MDFISLDFTDYRAAMAAVLFGSIFGAVIIFLIGLYLQGKDKTKLANVFAIVALIVITSGGIAGITLSTVDYNVNKDNEVKLSQNIIQKYDVKEVDWKSADTTARADGATPDGKILVLANNGNEYVFKYELDKETSEPTLKNMPIQGGNTPDKSASAESLLKDGK